MAERVDVVEKSMEDLEKEITCPVCQDHYTDPKVLPCLHYYCKQCIYRLALRTGLDKPFSCPKCHRDTTLPQGCVDNLQTAFFINRMKELHSKMERAHGKVDAWCELCSGDKTEAFCRQCAQFICSECIKAHQRMKKSFSGHKIATLDELKEGGVKEIITQESPLQTCKEHDQSMNMYCFNCSSLICRDCTIIDHSGHKYEFIKKAAPQVKKKLIQQLEHLKEVHANLSCAVEEIQTNKCEIEAQGDSVVNDIEESSKELQRIIESRKQELLKEVATEVTQKLERLSVQKKSLSTDLAVVQSVIEYTEQSIEHSSKDEIMSMHTGLENRIDREIKEGGRRLDPVEEELGIVMSCAEDFKNFCQTKFKLLSIDPAKCIASGEGVKTAEINKMSKFYLETKLANGRDMKRKCDVVCHLKSLVNESVNKCDVDRNQGNKYCIQYTPTVRGRHEIIVTVNGQEIVGNPFPVFVSIPPTQLSKPVKVIETGDMKPWFIAVNSRGEMVVTGSSKIDIFDKKGMRSRNIDPSDYGLTIPTGVAIDSSDSIYITERKLLRVVKLSEDAKLQTNSSAPSQFRGATIVGDELMVCDNGRKCIHVYTTDLEYVRQINSQGKPGGFKYIRDISSDQHGNLYVSDRDSSCVHVLSNGGEFLRTFGCDENGVNKLKYPYGVCVDGQYVYVSDDHNHDVSVFNTEGAYVTSFGQGDFLNPNGVCIDKDGFVFICDNTNSRIQIF